MPRSGLEHVRALCLLMVWGGSQTLLDGLWQRAFSRQASRAVYLVRHGTALHNVRYKRKDRVFRELINARSKTEADRDNRWLFPEIEEWAYMTNETVDTALVDEGVREATSLGSAWAEGSAVLFDRGGTTERPVPLAMRDVDLVVTSPLTRTLQTTLHIFFRREPAESGQGVLLPRFRASQDGACRPDPGRRQISRDCPLPGLPILALDLVKEWSQGRHTPNRRQSRSALARQYPMVSFDQLDSEEDLLWRDFWPGDKLGLEPRSHLEARVEQFKEWLAGRPEQNIVVVSHGTFLGNLLFGTFIEDTVEMAHCKVYSSIV